MALFQKKFRIESIRLKSWDYRNPGYYFVTICIQGKKCLLGSIAGEKFQISSLGSMVENFWQQIPKQFHGVEIDDFIIMPNHVHGIIVISDSPDSSVSKPKGSGITGEKNPMIFSGGLSQIIRWFKGRTTFEIRKTLLSEFSWQPRFYEQVIRNDKALDEIRTYILENPIKWENDENNPGKNFNPM
jgi:REP element-mobilizing transposase RayT